MTRHAVCLVLGSVLAFAGCEKKDAGKPAAPAAPKTGAVTPPATPDAKTGGAAAAFDAGKAAAVTAALKEARDKAVASATATLDGMTKQFDGLKAKAPSVPADAKTGFDSVIKDLDTQFAGAKTHVEAIKAAAADAWQKPATELQAALTKLGDSLKAATDKYGK